MVLCRGSTTCASVQRSQQSTLRVPLCNAIEIARPALLCHSQDLSAQAWLCPSICVYMDLISPGLYCSIAIAAVLEHFAVLRRPGAHGCLLRVWDLDSDSRPQPCHWIDAPRPPIPVVFYNQTAPHQPPRHFSRSHPARLVRLFHVPAPSLPSRRGYHFDLVYARGGASTRPILSCQLLLVISC